MDEEIQQLKEKLADLEQQVRNQREALQILIDCDKRQSVSLKEALEEVQKNMVDAVLAIKQGIIDDVKASLHP